MYPFLSSFNLHSVCISSQLSLFNIDHQAFTLFSPTNEAFANIPRELRARVDSFHGNIENPILRYHVSDRKGTSDTFQADQTIPTLYNGNRLRINKY